MSRHRSVRNICSDEYDDNYDMYGTSVEDDYGISPDAARFIYDRENAGRNQSMGAYLKNEGSIEEGNEMETTPEFSDEKIKLESCVAQMKSAVGDSIPEQKLIESAIKHDYNPEKALNAILTSEEESTSQDVNSVENKTPFLINDDAQKSEYGDKMKKINFTNNSVISNISKNSCLGLGRVRPINLKKCETGETQNLDNSSVKFGLQKPIKFGLQKPIKFNLKDNKAEKEHDSVINSLSSSVERHLQTNSDTNLSNYSSKRIETDKTNECDSLLETTTDSLSKITLTPSVSTPVSAQSKREFSSLAELVADHYKNLDLAPDSERKPFSVFNTPSKKSNPDTDIDLSIALCSAETLTCDPRQGKNKDTESDENVPFVPQFVNCEPALFEDGDPLHMCRLNISDVSTSKLVIEKSKSHFGKVICKKFYRRLPFNINHMKAVDMKHFNFKTKSPDDMIIERLGRVYKKTDDTKS